MDSAGKVVTDVATVQFVPLPPGPVLVRLKTKSRGSGGVSVIRTRGKPALDFNHLRDKARTQREGSGPPPPPPPPRRYPLIPCFLRDLLGIARG